MLEMSAILHLKMDVTNVNKQFVYKNHLKEKRKPSTAAIAGS